MKIPNNDSNWFFISLIAEADSKYITTLPAKSQINVFKYIFLDSKFYLHNPQALLLPKKNNWFKKH